MIHTMNMNSLKKVTDNTCDVFISYSGLFGKFAAEQIQELVVKIFKINKDRIFFAPDSLHGEDWVKQIQKNGNSCQVGISCLTSETYKNPWILYELGVMNSKALIIPLAIDFPITFLSGFDFYTCRQVESVVDNNVENFQLGIDNIKCLLKRMLIAMQTRSAYIKKLIRSIDGAGFNGSKENLQVVEKAAIEIKNKYDRFYKTYSFFISRPMQGYSNSEEITEILKKLLNNRKDVYYSKNDNNIESPDAKIIGQERIDNIRQSDSFVLVYPTIKEGERPSSCLIELGAALSMNKNVKIFYESGSRLPSFMEKWETDEKVSQKSYGTNEELVKLLGDCIGISDLKK